MSSMNAFRNEHRLQKERDTLGHRALLLSAGVAVIASVVVIGLDQAHLLPVFSADDFGSILFWTS